GGQLDTLASPLDRKPCQPGRLGPGQLGSYNSRYSERLEYIPFAPMLKFDDRFARQNRCEPPPEFPLASPYSSIVHHLSGPTNCALTQILQKTSRPVDGAPTGRLKPLCQHPKLERGRTPALRQAAFLSPNRRIRQEAITHPRVPPSSSPFPSIRTDVGPHKASTPPETAEYQVHD
ncbi:hypothetical protein CMV_026963, partial [Castanea mollissima]